MAALTTVDIGRLWASAFAADRHLKHWSETNYERPFFVQIGADMRRPPNAGQAPFINIFPDTSHTGPQRAEHSHELGIVAGILDEAWIEQNGITEMQALVRLNELCPKLEAAMRGSLTQARVQEFTTEYEILEFPLVMALFTITVEETLPVGRR